MEQKNHPSNAELEVYQERSLAGQANSAAIVAAETNKARIQAAYLMAIHSPRDEKQSRVKILEACRRPKFAEAAIYNKPVGKGVKGPSIRFAEEAIRLWKNLYKDVQLISEDERYIHLKVSVIDLESNVTHSQDISVPRTVERARSDGREVVGTRLNSKGELVYIVKATEDEIHNLRQSLISKIFRNEGLRHIPADILEEAMEECRETNKKRDAEDPTGALKKVIDAFYERLGKEPADLDAILEHKLDTKLDSIKDVTTPMGKKVIEFLRGAFTALESGDAKWSDYLPEKETKKDGALKGIQTDIEKGMGGGN